MSDNLGNIINRADAKIYPVTSQAGVTRTFINESVVTEVSFLPTNYKSRWIKFVGCTFQGHVSFIGVDLGIGITFQQCIFERGLSFHNVTASGFDAEFDPSHRSLILTRCEFRDIVSFGGSSTNIQGDLCIEACSLGRGIIFDSIRTSSLSVGRGSSIDTTLHLLGVTVTENINFSECKINCQVRFEVVKCEGLLSFQECECSSDIKIWSGVIGQGVTFHGGSYQDTISIQVVKIEGILTLFSSVFHETFTLDYNDAVHNFTDGPQNIFINNCDFQNGIYIGGAEKDFVEPNVDDEGYQTATDGTKAKVAPFYFIIKKIEIKFSPKLKGDITIRNLSVGLLAASGFNTTANLIFDHIEIYIVDFINVYNSSKLVFSNIRSAIHDPFHEWGSKFSVVNSNLGNTQLLKVNLNSFHKVTLHNVILIDIGTSLIKWPKEMSFNNYPGEKGEYESGKAWDRAQRELFRQLKIAMEKQGNTIEALNFRAKEMIYYKKELTNTSKWYSNNRLILWSSRSNDFGQNWIKAILLLLLCVIIFYIPISFYTMTDIDFWHWDLSGAGFSRVFRGVFWDQLGLFPQLFLPTHSLDKFLLPNQHPLGILYLFDVLCKIFTSYFIFQTISAFRKYVKT